MVKHLSIVEHDTNKERKSKEEKMGEQSCSLKVEYYKKKRQRVNLYFTS